MGKYSNDIKTLQHALDVLDQHSFLMPEDSRFNDVLRECVKLLRDNHYTVKVIPKIMKNVKNLRGLVALFYNELTYYHSDTVQFKDEKVDMTIAKNFVKKIRELTSLDYVPAIAFCANLIQTVFKYEKEFGFKPGTLYNFRVFGQKEMKWVTEKALYIYNRERHDEEAMIHQADIETEQYEKTHDISFGYGSEEEIKKLIDKL